MEEPRIVMRTSEYPNTNDPMVIPKLHRYMVDVFFSFGFVGISSIASLLSSLGQSSWPLAKRTIQLSLCICNQVQISLQASILDKLYLIILNIFNPSGLAPQEIKIMPSQSLLWESSHRFYLISIEYSIVMGAEATKIQLTQTTTYQGDLHQNQPHGQGKLTFTLPSQGTYTFQGKFTHGEPVYGHIQIGNLHYEGDIIDRKAEGNGKLTDSQTNTIYEGKFQNGKLMEGSVTKKNQYHCQGKFENYCEEYTLGQNAVQVLHGDGSLYENYVTQQRWKGNFWKGNISGAGEYSKEGNCSYVGDFYGGKYAGEGTLVQQNSDLPRLEGRFEYSEPKQITNLAFTDGSKFRGSVKNRQFEGTETEYRFADGTVFKGTMHQHTFTGECQIMYPAKSPIQIYRGEVHQGKFNGLGILEYRNGVIVKGYFCQNVKNGPCILVYGDRMYKGLFMMDKLIGSLQEIPKDP